jgi:hypothetical protein
MAWKGRHTIARWLAGSMFLLVQVAAAGADAVALPVAGGASTFTVEDIAVETRFQDSFFGHFKRGRALIAADFDVDGRQDFFVGNPGDESFVLRNVSKQGQTRFEVAQTLLVDDLAWSAAAGDFDDDGDPDLFVSVGGIEGAGFDPIYRNMRLETGRLRFEDVTAIAGVSGPVPPGSSEPIGTSSAGAALADYDGDGDTDIFVSTDITNESPPQIKGRNTLWRNDGDWSFTDVTDDAGLGTSLRGTRLSTFIDADNDGDPDLYENNYNGGNILWRNLSFETGDATFEDATDAFSPPGEDLSYPKYSFASSGADVNNDGWDDLVVYMRGAGPEPGSPYPEGHAIFLNMGGTGFINIASETGVNSAFLPVGMMGCQVGDVTGDGVPDVYIGNGGPPAGQADQFFVSRSAVGDLPLYEDATTLIDFPAPQGDGPPNPAYPYRTHGTTFVDVDGDGSLEVAVASGGAAKWGDSVQEPNRLFKLIEDVPHHYFKVRAIGDGLRVSKDAIGTRLALTVSQDGGEPWTVYQTLFGSNCFSAQNGFDVLFGLAQADTIHELRVLWADGSVEVITKRLNVNDSIRIFRADSRGLLPTGSWSTGTGWQQVDPARIRADRPAQAFSVVQLGPGEIDYDCDG